MRLKRKKNANELLLNLVAFETQPSKLILKGVVVEKEEVKVPSMSTPTSTTSSFVRKLLSKTLLMRMSLMKIMKKPRSKT